MTFARTNPSRQRGVSMIGFLFFAVIAVMLAMLAMKLIPAYVEFFSVKKILTAMGQESDIRSKSNAQIRSDFSRRASAGYVTEVKPEDLTIDRSSGVPVITADYTFRTRLVGHASLVIDFSASSDPNAAPPQIE